VGVSHALAVACFAGDAGDKGFDDTVVARSYHEDTGSASPLASRVVDHWDGNDSSCNLRVDCRNSSVGHPLEAEHSKIAGLLGILTSSRIWGGNEVMVAVCSWEHCFRYHDMSILWSRSWSPWNDDPQVPADVAASGEESMTDAQPHEDSSPPQWLAYHSSRKADVWQLCLHDDVGANVRTAACGHQRVAFSFCWLSGWWEIGSHLGCCWQQSYEEGR
jgi:hypothetical protein